MTYTSTELLLFARYFGCSSEPYRWDEWRRFVILCELDAAFFHLYGVARDDIDYVLETFPLVKARDEQQYGEYRTKRVILEIYDEMQESTKSDQPYKTHLDPAPGYPATTLAGQGV